MTTLEVAKSLLYVREMTGHNDHPAIDRMLDYLGLPHNLSWCLAFCLWCVHVATNPMPYPKIARCLMFLEQVQTNDFRYETFDADDIAWGINKAKAGDIMIFSHSKVAGNKNWNGHAALVVEQVNVKTFRTCEGNTSSDNKGSQREGNGVFMKTRSVKNGSLSLEAFVRSRR